MSFSGFIVHAYPDIRRNRLYCVGRLADGRSFAAVEEHWRPYIHIFEGDRSRALPLLSALRFEEFSSELEAFSGTEPLRCLRFFRYGDRLKAVSLLEEAVIQSPDAGIKPAELFLIERHIRGPVIVQGQDSPGRRVDLVIRNPKFFAPEQMLPEQTAPQKTTPLEAISLRIASVDIETDVKSGVIRAVSVSWADNVENIIQGIVRVVSGAENPACDFIFYHVDEKSLLSAFIEDIRRVDPDVLTGWNFLDFDFPRLAERCDFLGLPFVLGRSSEPAKFFPGDAPSSGWQWRRRSASAIVPGRQVLDALRIMRAGTFGSTGGLRVSWGDESAADFTLETVARTVLGEGKIVHSSGEEKIAELEKLYTEDPRRFGEYCLRDAELVLRILAKTGLFRLTLERASLTGVSLDKAWTSVVSFERIYGMELRRKGIAAPAVDPGADVSGAAGGTVLDPMPGLFNNVAVFDFRSLYPTIMLSFNIDPLAHARAGTPGGAANDMTNNAAPIIAPNGAAFSRNPGLLPAIIAEYFAARRRAIDAGDSIAAQVYKILMNSFYGVLGTGACRYGRTALAGAITSFARKWLLFSRDWFSEKGFRVLYGDTDSLFVETDFNDSASFGDFAERCGGLAKELNKVIAEKVRADYDLESHIELRFEKAYRRFLIPPLRNVHADTSEDSEEVLRSKTPRGRAKGYSGYLIHAPGESGETPPSVEVRGMEAVRSDTTPLARRLQLELLELVFSGCSEEQFRAQVQQTIEAMRAGKLDSELVYRKRLSRYPETYTASTPPQVKAARALGWKKRRGTVEYLWTVDGPLPVSLPHGAIDYDHYAASQVFPLARSIAEAAHWDPDFFAQGRARSGRGAEFAKGQIEIDFS
ncbi:MAG: DNA polymerase II [Treponema sp.]|jgi:DNA polymerase-2|nr:DNA polymerase II [Treponema sp.]